MHLSCSFVNSHSQNSFLVLSPCNIHSSPALFVSRTSSVREYHSLGCTQNRRTVIRCIRFRGHLHPLHHHAYWSRAVARRFFLDGMHVTVVVFDTHAFFTGRATFQPVRSDANQASVESVRKHDYNEDIWQ